jgi:hypothetical protein
MKIMAKFVGKNREFRNWLKGLRRCNKAWERLKVIYQNLERSA